MKKILALLLALIMCVGVFAACGEKEETEEPKVEDNGDETEDKTDDKAEDDTQEEANPNIVKTTFDMTDMYTLVIKEEGVSYIDRMGVRAEEGKIQCGYYNPAGRRTRFYEFDWASLNLPGQPWEYLGSEVLIDTTDAENPKMASTPIKSMWCVKASDITFPDENTLQIPDGTTFDLKIMNYGEMAQNFLFNQGSVSMPKWNWVKNCNKPSDIVFSLPAYNSGYYVLMKLPQYNKNFINETLSPINGNLNDNNGIRNAADFPAPHDGAPGEEYVIVSNEVRSLGKDGATGKYTIRVVRKDVYETYLATGTSDEDDTIVLNYADSEDALIGTVLLIDYNRVDEKYFGIYKTGEVLSTTPAA